jgi:hypothetical protein
MILEERPLKLYKGQVFKYGYRNVDGTKFSIIGLFIERSGADEARRDLYEHMRNYLHTTTYAPINAIIMYSRERDDITRKGIWQLLLAEEPMQPYPSDRDPRDREYKRKKKPVKPKSKRKCRCKND